MIAKSQSDIQKKIDKLFAEFAKARLSETAMRLKQGRLLKQVVAYCEANNCSFRYNCRRNRIEPKKALALISIWEAHNAKTLTLEKIGDVGWCKLMLIAPKLGAGMDAYWIKKAMTTSIVALKAAVLDAHAARVQAMAFNLTDDERGELTAILQVFGATQNVRGMNNRDHALMAMARHAARTSKANVETAA